MPSWVPAEIEQIAPLIREIENFPGPRRCTVPGPVLNLPLSEAIPLLDDLSAGSRALVVRQLCRLLEFDEHRHCQWRLEHKLVQALVLNHYCPGAIPITQGLDSYVAATGADDFRRALHAEYPAGFFIKRALGDSSGERSDCDRTHLVIEAIEDGRHGVFLPPNLIAENFILQERVHIETEYRVHTIEDHCIEALTFQRYGRGNIPGERDAPNAFVQSILDKLPNGIIASSLCGWDVALTREGSFRVIEVNFSGLHPVYNRGYHTSGFYHDYEWGANITARLLRHLEETHQIQVRVHADVDHYPEEREFYAEVATWQERLKTEL
jgi:ATP-grasp domain, R2K clade family 3